jgi:palmitoyltransferase ZDHHC3/7/25
MSALVWVLMLYSAVTVTLLTITEGIPVMCGMAYDMLCFMALACHAKTSLTDPGSVPLASIPSERQRLLKDSHSMCGQCQTFKPPMSHHCRICNRCISRMDHHCPWVSMMHRLLTLSKRRSPYVDLTDNTPFPLVHV